MRHQGKQTMNNRKEKVINSDALIVNMLHEHLDFYI